MGLLLFSDKKWGKCLIEDCDACFGIIYPFVLVVRRNSLAALRLQGFLVDSAAVRLESRREQIEGFFSVVEILWARRHNHLAARQRAFSLGILPRENHPLCSCKIGRAFCRPCLLEEVIRRESRIKVQPAVPQKRWQAVQE